MNILLKFLLIFNTLINDGDCLPKPFLNFLKATGDGPHFRVINGTPAEEKELPYQVSMKILSKIMYFSFCGGTIIAPSKVLTAAHCFYEDRKWPCYGKPEPLKMTNVFAVAGSLYSAGIPSEDNYNSQWRKIVRTLAPNDYVFPRKDIAIVFTLKPFIYSDFVNQIPYAREYKTYTDKKVICIASGYGQTEDGFQSATLLWAKLEILPTYNCSKLHTRNMKRFVCSTDADSDIGPGDSGGPLVCSNTGHPNESNKGILVGVASGKQISKRRGKDESFSCNSFFTRVSSYEKFIQNEAQIIVSDITLCILCLLVCLHIQRRL